MKTNFEKVTEFNKVMGLANDEPFGFPSLKQQELRRSLIHEECIVELDEAIEERNIVKVMDMCGDGLVVVYGLANDFGFDADVVFAMVHQSNMSKACITPDEAQATVNAYGTGTHPDKLGEVLETHWEEVEVCGKPRFVVYNSKTGKGLKSINYKPVDELLVSYARALEEGVDSRAMRDLWVGYDI